MPWALSAGILLLDQATKLLVVRAFAPGQSLPLLPVLHLTYVQNTGAAFGLLKGRQFLFILLSLAVSAWVVGRFLAPRAPHPALRIGYALILGGALGNLIDRIRLGYVIDFLDLRVWPVFNVADSAITLGVGWLVWLVLRGVRDW